jgi:hypothetical protein
LRLSDDCQFGEPRTLFKLVAGSNSAFYPEFTNNNLELNNTAVRNIFYGMNSMINMTEQGGRVALLQSRFEQINICGAIMKNSGGGGHAIDLGPIDPVYISSSARDLIATLDAL